MSDQTTTLELPITGMTCASCVARNERALRKVEGVDEAAVNFATEKATSPSTPAWSRRATSCTPSRRAGYGVVTAQETLPILGMTCASCVSRVERALRKPPGVLKADVNLATEKATVTYIPGQASRATSWRPCGRPATTSSRPAAGTGEEGVAAAADAAEAARAAAYRTLKLKVIVGFVLSIVIFAGTMQPDWFPFLPDWLHNGYVLWALATPVQFWVGRPVLHHRLVGAAPRHDDHEHAGRHGLLGGLLLQRPRRALPRVLRGPGPGRCRCTSTRRP